MSSYKPLRSQPPNGSSTNSRTRPALVFNTNPTANQPRNVRITSHNRLSSSQPINRSPATKPALAKQSHDVEMGQSHVTQSVTALSKHCYRRRLAFLVILPLLAFTLLVLASSQYLPTLWSLSGHSVNQTSNQPNEPTVFPNLLAPALTSPYFEHEFKPVTFHTPFFNEPYARDRNVPEHDDSITHSNRAIPHHFPSPLPFVPKMFGRELVIGAMCYNLARIEVLIDTWGKYSDKIYIFSEEQPDEAANIKQSQLRQVIVMNNSMNAHRKANDRRASAWKVLPILEHLYRAEPNMEWFYVVDDDSFPVIPQVIDFTHNFYARNPEYSPSDPIYIGQSVTKNEKIKPYYADDKPLVLTKPLRYFCTGGGVLMNKQLVHSVAPKISTCPVTFASDLTLGYCIQSVLPNVSMIEMNTPHILWARTVDEVSNMYGFDESQIWKAAAFHHMREPFIGNIGINMRLESYLRESEMRTHSHYLHRVHELRESSSHPVNANQIGLPTLVISTCDASSNQALDAVVSLLSTSLAPMAAMASIGFDTDLFCVSSSSPSSGSLLQHVQRQLLSKTDVFISQNMNNFRNWGLHYRLVLSFTDIPSEIVASNPRTVFASFGRQPHQLANAVQLASDLVGMDETSNHTMSLPRDMLYYGVFHSLFSAIHPSHYTMSRESWLVYRAAGDPSVSIPGMPSDVIQSFDDTTPVGDLVGKFMTAKLCLFPSNTTSEAMARRVHWSIAGGCLAIVSQPVAATFGLRELLSPNSIIAPGQSLLDVTRKLFSSRLYGAELGYQRFALNAHFVEKPVHQLALRIGKL